MPVDVGVPQGSHLGPLFLIFCNDISATLTCEVNAYENDSNISYSADDGGTQQQQQQHQQKNYQLKEPPINIY